MKCQLPACESEATFHFTRLTSRRAVSTAYMCDSHAKEHLLEFRSERSVGSGIAGHLPGLVNVDFEYVIHWNGSDDDSTCIYLHEIGGYRRFATITDTCAWASLMSELGSDTATRPPPHTGWSNTIRNLGADLQAVVVKGMNDTDRWFHTALHIVRSGESTTVDVRASDAYILATIFAVPIFIEEETLEKCMDTPDRF